MKFSKEKVNPNVKENVFSSYIRLSAENTLACQDVKFGPILMEIEAPTPFGRAAAGCLRNERNIWPFTPVNVSCHSSWDYYSQCHWPRCVRRWAGNHSASDVNGSGVQSTQLGHGETLTFLILFLNLSFFSVLHCCKRDMQDGGILTSTKISESSSIIPRLITFGSAWG